MMNNPSNLDVNGLPWNIVHSIEAMIASVRNELQKENSQSQPMERKSPWTVIEGVKIGEVRREDFYDDELPSN